MIDYDMPLFRPPSEARNLILQVTLGCSFNRCSFCSMYRSKAFRVRSLEDVRSDIQAAFRFDPGVRRVFLADGDALTLPTEHLLSIAGMLHEAFPRLQRISSYAWPLNIHRKTDAELLSLRKAGISLLYVGFESGDDALLKIIRKGASRSIHAEAVRRARGAGMKISATVVLGLGGRGRWEEHIRGTAALVNEAPPNYLSTLQLGLAEEIREEFLSRFPEGFEPQDDEAMLLEQKELLKAIDPPRPVIFRSNHASNALALAGNLPRDRERLIAEIDAVQEGERPVRPRWMRGY